jgi:hypothetical protein
MVYLRSDKRLVYEFRALVHDEGNRNHALDIRLTTLLAMIARGMTENGVLGDAGESFVILRYNGMIGHMIRT